MSNEKWQEIFSIDEKISEYLFSIGKKKEAKSFDFLRNLLYELVRINSESYLWAKNNSFPSVETYPYYHRAREIGYSIYQSAGFGGMQSALKTVKRITSIIDNSIDNFSLLEYGWEGIGGWQV